MRYVVMKEIKSKTKVNKWLYVQDIFFLAIFVAMAGMFRTYVYDKLQVAYWIFTGLMGLLLRMPSVFNPKRRMYESFMILVKKNLKTYKPIPDVNNCSNMEEVFKYLDD